MVKFKSMALSVVFVLISSTILTACQTALSTEQIQGTMNAAVNETMAAMPTATLVPTATAIPTPTSTPTPVPVQYGPSNFPDNVDPLTGLTVADPSILVRRPVMVKASNFPREGRPQAGLSKADIVFDYSTGEGANRFLALYYGQNSDQVGPIRSGRYIDEWLVSMYQGVLGMMYAWAPEYAEIVGRLSDQRVINGTTNTCPAICNKNLGISEISWFANTAEMTKYYEKSAGAETKPVLDGMLFNTIPPVGGADGSEVNMHFGKSNESFWQYDTTLKKYLGSIDYKVNDSDETFTMIPWVDRNTNEQLAFSNVIIVFASYTTLNGDDTLHQVSLVGASGRALIYRDGQVYDGIWKGINTTGPLQFFDASHKPMELQPGNSFIAITGTNSVVTQDSPGSFKVSFYKP